MRGAAFTGDEIFCDVRVLRAYGGAVAFEATALAGRNVCVESELYFGVVPLRPPRRMPAVSEGVLSSGRE
jgi:hypothetical protein